MTWLKKAYKNIFQNKKAAAMFFASTVVMVSYQNCAKMDFDQGASSLKLQTVLTCEGPNVACETDRGTGTQSCTNSDAGPVYGSCILNQCRPPYNLVNGQCVESCYPVGVNRACPNIPNGTGTQACEANGNWGSCQVTCDAGFYLNPVSNLCVPEFFNMKVVAYKKATETVWNNVTPTNSLQTKPGYQYRIKVDASPNLQVLTDESGIEVIDIGNPVRVSQCKAKENSMWNPMSPWGLEGPCANLQNCPVVISGNNDWNYDATTAGEMGGCGWLAEISAKRVNDNSAFRKVTRLTVDALLCEPGTVIADPTCPSGNKVCSADGRQFECVSPVTTTLPPPTTTVTTTRPPVTTTTVTVTTTTRPLVTTTTVTTTTRPVVTTTTMVTTTTRPIVTTTTRPPTTTTVTTTRPPTTTTLPPTCTNGAVNPPSCNACVSGQSLVNGRCYVNCNFNGETLTQGQVRVAYQLPVVQFGSSCLSESRTCNNGYMSGSYQYTSCSVTPPANCNFNGQTVLHGQSVTAYGTDTVYAGQSCSTQTRTCYNGTLSGNYGHSSCSVNLNCPPPGGIPTGSKCRVTEYCQQTGQNVRTYDTGVGAAGVPATITATAQNGQVIGLTAAGIRFDPPYTLTRWDTMQVRCVNNYYQQVTDGWCAVRKAINCAGGGSTGGGSGGGGSGGGGRNPNQPAEQAL